MITTLVDRGGNFYVTAKNPAGPWSDPVWLSEIDGIDPSFFFDDDGKSYILNNGPPVGEPLYEGHRAIWIQQYDFGTKKLVGPRSVIVNGGVDLAKKPIWIEAPHIFKRDGTYYLICAEGGTADQHSEVVFRSQSVMGPYVPVLRQPDSHAAASRCQRPFPIETTGHADFVETPNGEWWAVFLGTRNYGTDLWNTGRETFLLPVTWVDGWPTILTGQATVPYVHARPSLPRQATATGPAQRKLRGSRRVRREDTPAVLGDAAHAAGALVRPCYFMKSSDGGGLPVCLKCALGEMPESWRASERRPCASRGAPRRHRRRCRARTCCR